MEKNEEIQTEEENQINLSIKHETKTIFEIPITKNENLFEIRNVISDLPELYFTPNFHFEHEGKKLNEFEDIQNEVNLDDIKDLVLHVIQDDYDLRTLKDLIVRTNDFFEDPKGVAATLKFEQNNAMAKIDFFNITELKRKKSKKNKTKIDLDKALEGDLITLTQISNDHSIKPGLNSHNTFIQLLEYSCWNPPPRRRKMIGDFLYLKISTIEGKSFHVTAFPKGFYKNKSTDLKFDPTPDSAIFYSILELIASESSSFKAKGEQGIFENFNLHVKHINLPESKQPVRWLTHDEEIEAHKPNFYNAAVDIFNTHGNNINQYRDWNEELFNCKELPEDEIFLKLNKKKTQWKIASEFLEAAKCGAKAIIDGDLKPFNYNMSESEQCFVYNNIFYTYAIDDYMNLTQQRGENSPSTLALANNDLRNMSILLNSDIKGIETINSALISYKGHVIIAQSMIQGILHFDQKTWSKYGSIEEGKEIFFDEEFHKNMKEISKLFSIKDENVFKDGNDKEFNLATSIDIKGIQGGDGRKYVLDILRLSPRDYNWIDEDNPDEYNCCVLRLGLIKAYINHLKMSKVKEIRDKYSEDLLKNKQDNLISVQDKINKKRLEIMKENKQDKEEKLKIDFDDEDKAKIEEYNKTNSEISKKIEKEINETFKEKDIENTRFNPCLSTGLDDSLQISKEELGSDKEELKKISLFLKENMVNKLLLEWPQMIKLSPMDSESIASFFHKYSINLRYMGLVAQKMNKDFFSFQRLLLRRTMVVRALKHLLNEVLRNVSSLHISHTLSYLLNMVVGSKKVVCYLNQKCKKMKKSQRLFSPNSSSSSSSNSKKIKKRKKKKAKRKFRQIDTEIPPNEYLLLNSTEFFKKIKNIIKYKYKYELEEKEFFELKFCRREKSVLSFLRDICKSIGLVLKIRKFKFRDSSDDNFVFKEGKKIQSVELPIKDTDIIEFVPKVKSTVYEFSEVKKNLELANKCVRNENYEMALEIFSSCHHMLLSIYGPFFGASIESASNLSSLAAISGKIEQAIAMQKIIIEVSEKTFGIDDVFTLNAITILAGYYYENKNHDKAIETLLKSLYLADLIGGEYNSESMRFLDELHMLYFEKGDLQQSIHCVHEKTERLKILFEESHPLILKCYQRLGYLYLKHDNAQTALEYFELRLNLIKKFHSLNLKGEIEKSKKFIDVIKNKLSGGNNQDNKELSELDIETIKERVKIFKAMKKRKHF